MGLSINSSIASIFGLNQANRTVGRLNTNLEALSSALRINRAADDAAGLAIAEGFRSEVRGLNQEITSLQSGISAIQTAEGGLDAQQDAVGRIRELATQAANGTLSDDQRAAINEEAQALLAEIDATAQNTEFNGVTPLDGSQAEVQLDAEGNEVIQFQESTVASLGLEGLDLTTQAGAQDALAALEGAAEQINTNRAELGAQTNALASGIEVRTEESANLQAAESTLRDLDVALAAMERSRNETLLQSNLAAIMQGNLVAQTASRLLGV